jgi:hypothetical protein
LDQGSFRHSEKAQGKHFHQGKPLPYFSFNVWQCQIQVHMFTNKSSSEFLPFWSELALMLINV